METKSICVSISGGVRPLLHLHVDHVARLSDVLVRRQCRKRLSDSVKNENIQFQIWTRTKQMKCENNLLNSVFEH